MHCLTELNEYDYFLNILLYCKYRNYCDVFIIAKMRQGYNRNNFNSHFKIFYMHYT